MSDITVYSGPGCGYCVAAERLLNKHSLKFHKIDISRNRGLMLEMVQRSGRTSIPQIFIDERHIGGFDDLMKLERAGGLQQLSAQPPA